MNVFRRTLVNLEYAKNQYKPFDMPRPHIYRRLNCRLRGTLTIAGGTTNGTVVSENPATLIKGLEIIQGEKITSVKAPASVLYEISKLYHGTAGAKNAVTSGAIGTTNFYQDFHVDIEMPRCNQPWHTWLNPKLLPSLKLLALWGSEEDLIAGGDRTKTLSNVFLDVVSSEIIDPIDGQFSIYAIHEIEQQITAASTKFTVKLPIGAYIRALVIKSVSDGVPVDTILNNVKVIVNGIDTVRDFRADQLRDDNKIHFKTETFPVGYAVVEFLENDDIEELLDVRLASDAVIEANLAKPGTTDFLRVYPLQVIPPRF